MTDDNRKPINEWTIDELFAEMGGYFNYLSQGGEYGSDVFEVIKEIILRAGPPYEVYDKFTQIKGLLGQIENIVKEGQEFENLLSQSTGIWEEIKDWYNV